MFARGVDLPLVSSTRANGDGTFELTGLAGVVDITTDAPFPLKHILLRTTAVPTRLDVTAGDVTGIDVVLTQAVNVLEGRVRDGGSAAAADATVIVFAEDPERRYRRYIGRARALDGRYSVRGLADGDYLAVAVTALESGEESNPETLTVLASRATRVRLEDGATRALDLTVSTYP